MPGFHWLADAYASSIRGLIRLRWALLVVFLAALAGTWMLFQRIPSTFLPVEDQGYFFVVLQLPDGASLERTEAVAKKSEEVLRSLPGVTTVGSVVGFSFLSFANQSNAGVQFVILKPWDERGPGESATALREKAQQMLFQIPDAMVLAFDPPSIQGLGATGGFEFQVEDLTGRGAVALDQATQALDRRGAQAAGGQPVRALHHLLAPRRRSSSTTSTATRRSCSASTCRTSSTRCRSISARSTSTISTCSAARSASRCRPIRRRAPRPLTSRASMCATPRARWCR